jgi:phosphoribosyl 1,2-cyclic phosphodiesterase
MVEATLLGIAQDGGRPQPSCQRQCCAGLSSEDVSFPTSLGVAIEQGGNHLFDATRNLGEQLRIWGQVDPTHVWLTHAHFGHNSACIAKNESIDQGNSTVGSYVRTRSFQSRRIPNWR